MSKFLTLEQAIDKCQIEASELGIDLEEHLEYDKELPYDTMGHLVYDREVNAYLFEPFDE